MLHEIQDGDVVIVTLATKAECAAKPIAEAIPVNNVHVVQSSTATETSVHVIRAKKAEPTPKTSDGWPAWRDGKKEPAPVGSNVVYFDVVTKKAWVWNGVLPECQFDHWMPLPDGPK